jgi:hypothetical protein
LILNAVVAPVEPETVPSLVVTVAVETAVVWVRMVAFLGSRRIDLP